MHSHWIRTYIHFFSLSFTRSFIFRFSSTNRIVNKYAWCAFVCNVPCCTPHKNVHLCSVALSTQFLFIAYDLLTTFFDVLCCRDYFFFLFYVARSFVLLTFSSVHCFYFCQWNVTQCDTRYTIMVFYIFSREPNTAKPNLRSTSKFNVLTQMKKDGERERQRQSEIEIDIEKK